MPDLPTALLQLADRADHDAAEIARAAGEMFQSNPQLAAMIQGGFDAARKMRRAAELLATERA